jgi:lipopolysaccharide/colanic/teichoic acid biosynthesis glycosyltransferase
MSLTAAESRWRLAHRDLGSVGISRRAFDVIMALMCLTALAPVMAVIATAIYMESGRPVFFSQLRLGEHGRHFRLYKFRKFRNSSFPDKTAVTLANDNRMTPFGHLLARSKLDELPQLWNLFKGDMTLVGPRPESLAFADGFDEGYGAVLAFRPGIFGPNQVFFRDECLLYQGQADPEKFYRSVLFSLKARVDLTYFPRRTMCRDLGWIVRGLVAISGLPLWPTAGGDLVEGVETWIRQINRDGQA